METIIDTIKELDENQLYYILNRKNFKFLKLGVEPDSDGDRQAYVGLPNTSDCKRFKWRIKKEGGFYRLINAEGNYTLKVVTKDDNDGDRNIMGARNEKVSNQRDLWHIYLCEGETEAFHVTCAHGSYIMKPVTKQDDDGDHEVMGGNPQKTDFKDRRFSWVFLPANW